MSNAVGLLKEEMRRLGSFVMSIGAEHQVPAGGAFAVDRDKFSAAMHARVESDPNITVVVGEVTALPEARPLIVATGPLTGDALAADIERLIGTGALAYYDAIAPIVTAESIDWAKVFFASRWDKGDTEEERTAYVNCPFTKEEYEAFVQAVVDAKKVEPRPFEKVKYFEGCLPIEVMADRGPKTLSFGPMKPVGLTDPKTGRWPAAVVQLRREDAAGTAYNLVGFQTRMSWGEQGRVLRMIPGLENAEFYRYGAVHRNTFLNAPELLDSTFQLKSADGVYFSGQISGTEGYVESAASGWLVAHFVAERLAGREPVVPPPTTAHGGLVTLIQRADDGYQPSNINFSLISPWDGDKLKKKPRNEALAARALRHLAEWGKSVGVSVTEPVPVAEPVVEEATGDSPPAV